MNSPSPDDMFDDGADETIRVCLNLDSPKSFFLYAGAGSGKTRSLVSAIRQTCVRFENRLALAGQQVAVITYTNAACEEIQQRLEFNALVDVRTIHSFSWMLIEGFNSDIRKWVSTNLVTEIAELERLQARGRAGKASIDRARAIESKKRRLEGLPEIRKFIYSPTGDNRTRDSLNHAEVVAMTAEFLATKASLQRLLVSKFPILLIDESQDTNKLLMDAFLAVQAAHPTAFSLGLFGDTMQRIYADGKVGLEGAIPASWARPAKQMNHRCPKRVVELINKIREEGDGQWQKARSDKPIGVVRLFVVRQDADKALAEATAALRMAEVCSDEHWRDERGVKALTLEHHMAARRFGFSSLFDPLYSVPRLRTGMLDGSNAGLALFSNEIMPIVAAMTRGDRFAVAAAVKRSSPLMDRSRMDASREAQLELLVSAKLATEELVALTNKEPKPTLLEVLRCVSRSGLFTIPESLRAFAAPGDAETYAEVEEDGREDVKDEVVGWRHALESSSLDEVRKYDQYVRGGSKFGTHQGVKGLEFPRVMVVISDEEARGFMFSYEKLFGAKDKSAQDLDNEAAGAETTIDRTRRLLYVTCSRAEESLAIVYYSSDPSLIRKTVVRRHWFEESEVELLQV